MNQMKKLKARRITRTLTPQAMARIRRAQRQIARELPELIARDQMRKEAREEPTLSGELRRLVQLSGLPISKIAEKSRIPVIALDKFLTGERTLRSYVLDRLATSVGLELTSRRS
jgi:hypothetical protein